MGLPSIENFDISFIKRTSENLTNYKGDYEFTMLLNSLLGLIVVPNESKDGRKFNFDFWSKKLTDFPELNAIFTKRQRGYGKEAPTLIKKSFIGSRKQIKNLIRGKSN